MTEKKKRLGNLKQDEQLHAFYSNRTSKVSSLFLEVPEVSTGKTLSKHKSCMQGKLSVLLSYPTRKGSESQATSDLQIGNIINNNQINWLLLFFTAL